MLLWKWLTAMKRPFFGYRTFSTIVIRVLKVAPLEFNFGHRVGSLSYLIVHFLKSHQTWYRCSLDNSKKDPEGVPQNSTTWEQARGAIIVQLIFHWLKDG